MPTMRTAILSAVSLCALAIDAHAAAPPTIKVACVGDSITQNSGWSDRLGAKLGAGYTSTNYGVSGTTLLKKGDNPYWNTAQFTQSHSTNPDIVVIMLGTNDSKPFNWSAHKGEFVGDYEALIDSYAALPSHPKIYLNLCPPAGTNGYQIDGTVIENEVLPDIKMVAAAKGVPTIDVFDAFGGHTLDPSLYGSPADLVHPNAKGAQVIADTVYAALTAMPNADAGADGARGDAGATLADASTDTSAASGAGGSTGGAGTSGAGGSTGGAGTSGAAGTSGVGGGAGTSGAAGTSSSSVAGTSGGAGVTGAAGGPAGKASSSGGCAVASSSRPLSSTSAGLFGLALLALRRRRRARVSCTSR